VRVALVGKGIMRFLLVAAAVVVFAGPMIAAQSVAPAAMTADAIMAKVAANQDGTEAARMRYIYQQHIRITSRKPGGKVMCEEVTDSRVSPKQKESQQQLLTLDGRYWQKGRYLHYTTLQDRDASASAASKGETPKDEVAKDGAPKDSGVKEKEVKTEKEDLEGLDIDLVENLRRNLADDTSKDGLGKGLFPLTTEQQSQYLFKLEGRQTMNGREVYRVSFRPKDKNDFDWKGEAFIDVHEFEPVVVYTEMSRKIPLAVRTLLGTNLPGLGFSVTYDREPDGVWFPVSFGTEFRMRVLFFIARDISMSLANTHFEKTHADVRILDGVKMVDNSAPASPAAPAPAH
jgi:hypothetical protein